MIAILEHELKSYFHSLTAYVFGAFLLLFIGIGSMLYNLQAAVSNFEFVLSFSSIVFVVIVPILTMRVIAEERKQKTDQLLYSLPIRLSGDPWEILSFACGLSHPTLHCLNLSFDLFPIWGCVFVNFVWLHCCLLCFGCSIDCPGRFHFIPH